MYQTTLCLLPPVMSHVRPQQNINLLVLRGANAAKILVSMFSVQLIFCLCLCPAAVGAEITSLNCKS